MYIRVVNLKFSSKIDSDAMQALAKHEMINKKGNNGFIKLGKTNIVVLIISINWVDIECCSSSTLNICESQINPIKTIKLIKIYFK